RPAPPARVFCWPPRARALSMGRRCFAHFGLCDASAGRHATSARRRPPPAGALLGPCAWRGCMLAQHAGQKFTSRLEAAPGLVSSLSLHGRVACRSDSPVEVAAIGATRAPPARPGWPPESRKGLLTLEKSVITFRPSSQTAETSEPSHRDNTSPIAACRPDSHNG